MVSGETEGDAGVTEHELQNRIRVALSEYGMVFRTNAGTFWQGKRIWSRELSQPVLAELQKIEGLPEGFPDLLFIDERGCAFIEVKAANGRLRKEQKNFLDRVQAMGLRAGVARSVEDAINIISGGI